MIGSFVIARSRSAGVNTGYLMELSGTTCLLRESRKIWSWTDAFTLHEMSNHGCGNDSRISEAAELPVYLSEVIEILQCTPKAEMNLRQSRNGS